jgi:hypothetical protein
MLPDSREGEIDEHLAECDQCVTLAREFQAFSDVWDSWTAKAHGEAYSRATLATAMQPAAAQGADLRVRLQRWQAHLTAKMTAAVRMIRRDVSSAVQAAADTLDALAPPSEVWTFAFQPTPVRVRGGVVTREPGPAPAAASAATPEALAAQITVEKEAPQVEIRIELWPADQPLPLVLLIPLTDPAQSYVAELQRQPNATYLFARFENVKPGDYGVAFEPLSQSN